MPDFSFSKQRELFLAVKDLATEPDTLAKRYSAGFCIPEELYLNFNDALDVMKLNGTGYPSELDALMHQLNELPDDDKIWSNESWHRSDGWQRVRAFSSDCLSLMRLLPEFSNLSE